VVGASGYRLYRDSTRSVYLDLSGHVVQLDDENLDPGEIHTYWVRSYNDFGSSELAGPVAASTALNSPSNFTASNEQYPDHIVLNWTKSQNATGYEIYRDSSHEDALRAVLGDVEHWEDTTLTDWDLHEYRIRAVNKLTFSPFSSAMGRLIPGTGDTGPGTWPQLGRDSRHTYTAAVIGPTVAPSVGFVVFNPVLFGHTEVRYTVFGSLNCQYLSTVGRGLFALNPDGTHRWNSPYATNAAAVLSDGAVAATGYAGLYIINPDGSARDYDSTIKSSAISLHDSGDLLLSEDYALVRYNPETRVVWTYELPEGSGRMVPSVPSATDADGNIYFGTVDASGSEEGLSPNQGAPGSDPPPPPLGLIVALNEDGDWLWEFDVVGEIEAMAIGAGGSILASTSAEFLYSISPAGEENWTIPLRSTLAVSPDGTLICKENYGRLVKLDPADGSTIWEYDPPEGTLLIEGPIVDAEGNSFLAHEYEQPAGSKTYLAGALAVDADGELLWRIDLEDGYPSGLALDEAGTLWLSTKLVELGSSYSRRWWFR
jgi:outer membrane protein assembly factor BamB